MLKYYKFSLPLGCFKTSLLTLLPGSALMGVGGETIFFTPCGNYEVAFLSTWIKEETNYNPVYLGLHEGSLQVKGSGAF